LARRLKPRPFKRFTPAAGEDNATEYRSFLALSYDELEELNLEAKADRLNRVAPDKVREQRLKYLTDEKHIKRDGDVLRP